LGHTLKPLIRDGYVALVPDKDDRRVKHATLTKAGRKKLEQTLKLWTQAQQRFEKVFGEKRAADLRLVLEELSSEDFRKAYTGRWPRVPPHINMSMTAALPDMQAG